MGVDEGGLESEARSTANHGWVWKDWREAAGHVLSHPMVDAKCSYQNPESSHIKVDMVEWGPKLSALAWRGTFEREGTFKTKDSDAQVRICLRKENQVYA